MEEGTDAAEILHGRVFHLRLGYVPVVCRGQKAIQSKSPAQRIV